MISAAPWLINKSVQTEIACVSQQRDATKLKDAQSYGVICFFFSRLAHPSSWCADQYVRCVMFGNTNLSVFLLNPADCEKLAALLCDHKKPECYANTII